MSSSINLISHEKNIDSKEIRAAKLKKFSYLLLLVIGFLAIVVFLLNFRFSANAIRKEQERLLEELAVYDEPAAKMYVIDKRITDTSRIIKERKNYSAVIKDISKGLTGTVIIDTFKIENSQISINVSSTSLLDLNDFLNHLLLLSDKKTLSGVSIEELTLESTLYRLRVEANSL